ncbi:MAG: hypothetical protein NC541_09900 [bacterium]|nr:hypothetical protein [bacterium]
MRRILACFLIMALAAALVSCGSGAPEEGGAATGQKEVPRIARYEKKLPDGYKQFDYRAAALSYDSLVFGGRSEGAYLPLLWEDKTHDTFGFAAYVGDGRTGTDGAQEAVAAVAAVLSASLLGEDKSNQNGVDYVAQLHGYFSEREKVVLNNPGGSSEGASMWYMLYPTVLFTHVSILYPEEELIRKDTLDVVESWYKAYLVMREENNFAHTGFDFQRMQPYDNGIWEEPDCAAGIAVLMQAGYELTGREEYREAVYGCLDYLGDFFGSPLYEVLLYFAPSLAARMNAQQGTNYDMDDLLADVFNGSSIPRGGWGSIVGIWGDYCMNGLFGSTTDGGGYAFSMNTFAGGYALSGVAKYDTRYAAAMGVWYLNAAGAARYFFPGETAEENQSGAENGRLAEFIELSNHGVPYEGIRMSSNSRTPWVGGDPTVYGWAETDLSLYSGAHTGMFAAAAEPTDVEGILKIDCNAAEPGTDHCGTYLLYNPYEEAKRVTYELPEGRWDLFDSVPKRLTAEDAEGSVQLTLQPGEAAVIVEVPAGTEIVHRDGRYTAGGVWIASDTVTAAIVGLENNESVRGKVKLDVRVICTDEENAPKEIVLEIDGKETVFGAKDAISFRTGDYSAGSKTVTVTVRMEDGKTDQASIRLNFKE